MKGFQIGDLVAYKMPKYADLYTGIVASLTPAGVPIVKDIHDGKEHRAQNAINMTRAMTLAKKKGMTFNEIRPDYGQDYSNTSEEE